MSKEVYLKLNPKAGIFYDATTRILVRGKEIIRLEKLPKSKRVNKAISQGHLQYATQEEYEAFVNPEEPQVEVPKKTTGDTGEVSEKKKALLDLGSKKAILEHFEKEGWQKEDLDILSEMKAKDGLDLIVDKALEIDATYSV